jgi:ketosteroid isomerase-like protein
MQDAAERNAARVDIMDVINRYGAATDAGDWHRLRSCFTPDARLKFPTRVLEGPDAIVEHISKVVERMAWQQHLLGSHQIEVETDHARATCSLYATQLPIDPKEPILTTIATYYDELRLTDDGWKIAYREMRVGHRKEDGRSA